MFKTLAWFSVFLAPLATPIAGITQSSIGSHILTLNQERLFTDSLYGRRVAQDIDAASLELAAENRRIEAALSAEEQDLTTRRESLPPEEFRALADAFDAKVVAIRREQDTKARSLQREADQRRAAFLTRAVPILSELVEQFGAVAILDDRAVFLSADSIDITDEALARIDAILGDGGQLGPRVTPTPAPDDLGPGQEP